MGLSQNPQPKKKEGESAGFIEAILIAGIREALFGKVHWPMEKTPTHGTTFWRQPIKRRGRKKRMDQ